jgi:misacylated tRNA(Ala) deacylase
MTEELFRIDSQTRTCEAVVRAVDAAGVQLDRTVFYVAGGGQPGDCGVLRTADGREVAITDTRKDRETGDIVHVVAEGAPALAPGDAVTAEIDWERRHRLMRMHTCMHLLSSLISEGVTGGSVGVDKSRVDFNLPNQTPDKEHLTAELNRLVEENHAVGFRWITDAEMEARPELVRTMSVKPPVGAGQVRLVEIPGVDLQPCGGTHVASTAEIGRVRVAKIENKGKHNRRVHLVFDE